MMLSHAELRSLLAEGPENIKGPESHGNMPCFARNLGDVRNLSFSGTEPLLI